MVLSRGILPSVNKIAKSAWIKKTDTAQCDKKIACEPVGSKAPSTRLRNLKTQLSLYCKQTFHAYPGRHENGAFRKRSPNRRTNLKTSSPRLSVDRKQFENEANVVNYNITVIMRFLGPSFRQTHIQRDWWLWRFQISTASCERKTFDGVFESNGRSQISSAEFGRDFKFLKQ